MINEGLQKGIQNLQPLGFQLPNGDRVVIQIMVIRTFTFQSV